MLHAGLDLSRKKLDVCLLLASIHRLTWRGEGRMVWSLRWLSLMPSWRRWWGPGSAAALGGRQGGCEG
jgi:hypothetical protein